MSVRRVGGLALIGLATMLWVSCGQVYRPVVIPINTIPPNPANFHAVFSVNSNVAANQGTGLQIDVSGDSEIGAANVGVNPTFGASLVNNTRIFFTSAGSLTPGQADIVTAVTPAVDSPLATGMGNPVTYTMPEGSVPVYVNSTETGNAYVANYGTNSVSQLSVSSGAITITGSVGANPVALAETPNEFNLYVANLTDNTVMDLTPTDLSLFATIPVGVAPTWMTVRPDGQRLYVITQGDGQLYTINTATNAVIAGSPQSLGGPGANFVIYDKSLDRLYATNPSAGAVYIFDATTDPPTPIGSGTGALPIAPPPPCTTAGVCGPTMPTSVAALADGTRFYVASYATAATGAPCPDPNLATAGCIIPQVSVYNALNLAPKTTVFPLLPSVTVSPTGVQPFAVAPISFCAPAIPYSPLFSRFRMSAAAAVDSSHVYASICDAGTIADIVTSTNTIAQGSNTPDTLVKDLAAPFAACGVSNCNTAAITAFSITNNVVTFQAANQLVAGQTVQISGLSTGTYLNGLTFTVLGVGLSSTQFECVFANANVPLTADSGSATPFALSQNPTYLFSGQ